MLTFKAQSQLLREGGVKPARDKYSLGCGEASGGREGADTPCPPSPAPGQWKGLLKTGSSPALRRVCRMSSGSFWRLWDNLISGGQGTGGESLSDYRERQGSLAELLSPSGHLCNAFGA